MEYYTVGDIKFKAMIVLLPKNPTASMTVLTVVTVEDLGLSPKHLFLPLLLCFSVT